jgi:hypothetical protein
MKVQGSSVLMALEKIDTAYSNSAPGALYEVNKLILARRGLRGIEILPTYPPPESEDFWEASVLLPPHGGVINPPTPSSRLRSSLANLKVKLGWLRQEKSGIIGGVEETEVKMTVSGRVANDSALGRPESAGVGRLGNNWAGIDASPIPDFSGKLI